MKFENRNIGVFDLLSVQMLADEVFDAGRLRQETLRMVERGSRRLVIDLGAVDYLYSDSINALVALNRRMLESSGRMGILVPNPKVYDILVRAGLENIMRLYRSEADLLNDSRELMRQSSAWTRPAELLSAASASQMISANIVSPKNPSENRDTNPPGQRVPRKRVGSRVELRPRRRGGRSMDQEQPTSDFLLPPSLPSTPGESTTLRMLSQESSAFDKPILHASEPQVPPPRAASPEPTVFQVPDPPREGSYSGTDPWLLTMPSHPAAPSSDARPPAPPEAASSSFLPKFDPTTNAAPEADPSSNFPTALHWDQVLEPNQLDRVDPQAHVLELDATQPLPAISPADSSPAPPAPTPAPSAAKPAVPDIQSVIFYDDPPIKPPATSATGTPRNLLETRPLVWSDPKPAPPAPAPTVNPARTIPSTPALDHWFAGSPSSPAPVTPTEPSQPFQAPSQGTTELGRHSSTKPDGPSIDQWFASSAPPAKPVVTTPEPPRRQPDPPVAPVTRPTSPSEPSALDAWFGNAKPTPTKPSSPPTPSVSSSAPTPREASSAIGRATEPPRDFSGRSPSKPASTTGLDDWFAGTTAPPVKTPPPAPVAETPKPMEPAPAASRRPEAPFEASRPDPWFTGATATAKSNVSAKPEPAVSREPTPSPNTSAAAPALDAWMTPSPKAPPVDFPPSNAVGGTMWLESKPPRKPLTISKDPTSFLDLDDLTGEPPRSKKPLWIALIAFAVVVLGAVIVFLSSGTSTHAPEVPRETAVESPADPPPPPVVPATDSQPEAAAVVKPRIAPKETPEPASTVAAPTPLPAEDHAPVKIFVTSRPSGAVVLLDGTRVGTTPCEVTFKRAGKLEFTLAGYRQQSKDIDPEETRGTVNVQLFADGGAGGNQGRIYITSAPTGADIVVDGKNLGKTPRLVELPVGSQKVTVRSGAQSKTRSLEIQSGTNTAEFFSL